MKYTVRHLFTGDRAEVHAAAFFDEMKSKADLFMAVELDADFKDAVLIDFRYQERLKEQFLAITTALLSLDSWHIVGPKCPHYNGPNTITHSRERRFMMNFRHPAKGDGWTCPDPKCRIHRPLVWAPTYMDQSYFNQARYVVIETGKLPPASRIFPREPEVSRHVPLDTKNGIAKALLNVDYKSIEYATLFHSLGMRHTVDVKKLTDCESFEAGDWLDSGGGAVLLVGSDASSMRARSAVSQWMKKNEGSQRYMLAMVEVDTHSMNSKILNGANIREAAAELTKVRERLAIDTETTEQLKPGRPPVVRLDKDRHIAALTCELEKTKAELTELRKEVREPLEIDEEPSDLAKAADRMLRMLAQLNMQDHSVLEQRVFNERFHDLKDELMKVGIGSTPGKKQCPS